MDILGEQFPAIEFVKAATPEHAAEELVNADILVTGGPYYLGDVAHTVNTNAPTLRWIQSLSIGTDLFEQGGVPAHVTFTNAAGLKGRTVSEHAMALILGYTHALPDMERSRTKTEWGRDAIRAQVESLEGLTLLLLGYGSIGLEIARKAKAFDMHVIALNRSGHGVGAADEVAPLQDLGTWLPKADFVASSLPLTPDTHKLISDQEFSQMKPSAILINVGRGAVVDQKALIKALQQNAIAGACLDVFEQEPLPADDPIWQMQNVIISPHVGGTGGPIAGRFSELVAENLIRFQEGRSLKNEVNFTRD